MSEQNYEYKIVKLYDDRTGGLKFEKVESAIINNSINGWRFVGMYSNELGKNSTTIGYGGISSSTNATIDEHLIIFERKIKKEKPIVIKEKNLSISKINDSLPFSVKNIKTIYNEKEKECKIQITIKNDTQKDITGIKCDVIFHTVFNEEIEINDICFVNFKNNFIYLVSETNIDLSKNSISIIKNVSITIKKIVDQDSKVYNVNSPLKDYINIYNEKVGSDYDYIMGIVLSLPSAVQIFEKLKYAGIDPELLEQLQGIARLEKKVGNKRDVAIEKINSFYGIENNKIEFSGETLLEDDNTELEIETINPDYERIMNQIESAMSAAKIVEILNYTKVDLELMEQLRGVVRLEQKVGNKREVAIGKIKAFYNVKG